MGNATDEPIAHAMTTLDEHRARGRAEELNERGHSEALVWRVHRRDDGRFEVVALAASRRIARP